MDKYLNICGAILTACGLVVAMCFMAMLIKLTIMVILQ